jgi:hypothetical protein
MKIPVERYVSWKHSAVRCLVGRGRRPRGDRGKEGRRKLWNIFPDTQFLSNILEFTQHYIHPYLISLEENEWHITSNSQQTASANRHFRESSAKSSQQWIVGSKTLRWGPGRQPEFVNVSFNIPSL